MSDELRAAVESFKDEFYDASAGQAHLAAKESEARDVKRVFREIREKRDRGEDITDDVLRRLLPHTDSSYHRAEGYRVSTWPCIRKDVRGWFEGAGWKQPDEWPETARLLFEAIEGLVTGDLERWRRFLNSEYRRGFGTGFVSPILFCLDDGFPVINSKVVKTYRYCSVALGMEESVDAKLASYLENGEKVKNLVADLEPLGLDGLLAWDSFCHYLVTKGLDAGQMSLRKELEYGGWLFVARPDIFRWEEAFAEGAVEWTGSLGAYPQKLLRRSIRGGDRVFGYQAGPDYELVAELATDGDPYQTGRGSWAVRLVPVRRLPAAVSLAVLKAHDTLSELKFVKTPQLSISGITAEQIAAIDELSATPSLQTAISPVDELCASLRRAQYTTSAADVFEVLVSQAFELLGYEAERLGASGEPDVFVTARLGSDSYSAVVEAKTCQEDRTVGLGRVDYNSVADHQEAYTADYTLLVGPEFAGGKLVDRAVKGRVGMLTTEELISLLRSHREFPFSLRELQRLFEVGGPAAQVVSELKRVHAQHSAYLGLASTVVDTFEQYQRQQEASEPISSSSLYLLLLAGASREGTAPPVRSQIDEVLSLLANPIVGAVCEEVGGYVLVVSPSAAARRLDALRQALGSED